MQGLALTTRAFWAFTPRELEALRSVWQQSQDRSNHAIASIQSTLYNAHFVTDGVPWTADDLLGRGDRVKRLAVAKRDKMQAARANSALAQMKPGDKEGVPDWAIN